MTDPTLPLGLDLDLSIRDLALLAFFAIVALTKLIEAERQALDRGESREEAIQAAYDRFYRGDIAEELVRGAREEGALFTMEDLAAWEVRIEEPVRADYKGIEVYKLTHWVQGPVLLQMLNMLEGLDLAAMGYNSARYIHGIYQVMSRAFADRDFYYGDPYFPPEEPIEGLLSEDYAKERIRDIDWERNDPDVGPGDPYPYQGETNPFSDYLAAWPPEPEEAPGEAAKDLEDFVMSESAEVARLDGGQHVGQIMLILTGRLGNGVGRLSHFTQAFLQTGLRRRLLPSQGGHYPSHR